MWHSIWSWLSSGDWKPSFDGVAAIAAGVIGFIAIIRQTRSSERSVREQLEAEKSAREEASRHERYGTAAVLRSEVFSIWEVDLRDLSAELRKVPARTGTALLTSGVALPPAPKPYFPVFERCADKIGLLNRECVSLAVQFYKKFGELIFTWDEYNRRSDMNLALFARLHGLWKGLENGYNALIKELSHELGDGAETTNGEEPQGGLYRHGSTP